MKLRTPTGPNPVKGFAVMRVIRNGQCLLLGRGGTSEVRFMDRLFCRVA